MMQVGMGSVETSASAPDRGEAKQFTAPSVEDLAGLFPQLEIQALIGVGGMGAVYKAHQRDLDRPVALKILVPRSGSDLGFAERFMREARALARLSHPHIVAVYDFGHRDDLNYFIMEFVDGANLREVQKAGELSPEQALAIIPQICEALQFAHNEGVVHRDIKPENVLLDRDGRVRIADFGLAKIVGKQPQNLTLTAEGHVMGTPHYMAPEQVEHPHEVDHRADIYSLGVVFYEMLTGELPLGKFAAPSRMVQVDVRLDEVVLKALEKKPERRYQQASQVKTEVETIASTRPKTERRAQDTDDSEIPAESIADIKRDLRIPAFGLLVSGSLNLAMLCVIAFLAGPREIGQETPLNIALWLTLVSLLLFLALVVLWGSSCMRRLAHYRLAIDAAVLAILFSGCSGVGLIFGIWSLVVLSRKEVRQAFQQVRLNKTEAKGSSKRQELKHQEKHTGSRNKHSVIPPVGRRGDRRVLFWPGILNALLATIAISFISASGMGIIVSMAGDPVSLWTSLLSAVIVTVVFILMWTCREWSRPLEDLPDLDHPDESDEMTGAARVLRLRRGLQLCILLVVAFSCAGYFLLKPTVLVSGVVTDASTGEPIANAKVVDYPLSEIEGIPLQEVATDRAGRYRLYSRYDNGWRALAPGYCTDTEGRDKPRFSWLSRRRIDFELYPLFDPVVERTLYDLDDGEEDTALDIRTGQLYSMNSSVEKSEQLRKAWLRNSGIDLMVDYARNRWALLGVGLNLFDVDASLWDGATGQQDLWPVMDQPTMVLERKVSEAGTACLLAQDPCLPATFVFETNDLARGMLQITACLNQPRAVKLRYRLAPTMDAGRTSSRLAFRILPDSGELTERQVTRYREELRAKGPQAQDAAEQDFVWIVTDKKDVPSGCVVQSYQGRPHVLASNRSHEMMLSDGSWGLESTEMAKNPRGEPAVSVRFDGPGADRFFALTSAHIGKPLGIILGNKVISASLITGGIRKETIVDGGFSRRDAKIQVHALLEGTPPVASPTWGPVTEITLNDIDESEAGNLLDLDKGLRWDNLAGSDAEQALAFIRQHGVDLLFDHSAQGWALMTPAAHGLELALTEPRAWDTITPDTVQALVDHNQLAAMQRGEGADDWRTYPLPVASDGPTTLGFRTGSVRYGLLQVMERLNSPARLRLRFKLVHGLSPEGVSSINEGSIPVSVSPTDPLSGTPGQFGPTLERTILSIEDGKNCFLDLDTGRLLTPHAATKQAFLSKGWLASLSATNPLMRNWLKTSGADLIVAGRYNEVVILNGLGISFGSGTQFGTEDVSIVEDRIDRWLNPRYLVRRRRDPGLPFKNLISHQKGTRIFAVKTREGNVGMLEVRAYDPQRKHATVRYKLVSQPKDTAVLDSVDESSGPEDESSSDPNTRP